MNETTKMHLIDSLVKNIYVNAMAILSTVGLSLMQVLAFLDGVLPTVSLLLTTISVATLLYFNVKIKSHETKVQESQRRINELEIQKRLKELEDRK